MSNLILGLDPGSLRTGFGLIAVEKGEFRPVDHGVVRLPENRPLSERLNMLFHELEEIYSRPSIRGAPGVTVVEKVFFGKNADSAFKLGHARGVCLMVAARHGHTVHEYAARFVKKCVTGHGAAAKDHVQMVVGRLLNLAPGVFAHDASDALALAMTHAREFENNLRIRAAMERSL